MSLKKMPSSSAQDRQISVWFQKIENGEIKLPRFQRPQAWDRGRIGSLLNTVTQNLPLGVTLLLNVDEEQFVSRYLATAPQTGGRVTEHLLDGQQRLTALWRSLHNNYDDATYFLYLRMYDRHSEKPEEEEEMYVHCRTRWENKRGSLMPVWADSPKDCLFRGLIPMNLFRPGDISGEIDSWILGAIGEDKPASGQPNYENDLMKWMELKSNLVNDIRDVREIISHFNLPFLALPAQTLKDTALQVFINMNTNSKPLSQYDIIRAEIEDIKGISLDDYQKKLHHAFPQIEHYFELPFLILATSALMQDKLPNQRGMWDMKKELMIENWDAMGKGLAQMADFMEGEGVYDRSRLPTNAVLSVIAALYTYIPAALDARGKAEILLKKYLWSSFFTDRYENSAATNAFNDFTVLKKIITGQTKENGMSYAESDVPVLDRKNYPIATEEELIKVAWPKRENIRARSIMAVFTKLGAMDFADGSRLSRKQLIDGKRQYHHVFPDAILKQSGIDSFLALNCALITDKTNLNISNKEPYRYLSERYNWTSEDIVNTRLKSHLIPIQELKNGGYEGLSKDAKQTKVQNDFQIFLQRRATYVTKAVQNLVNGRDISANEIMDSN
jgi:hypothetical protein